MRPRRSTLRSLTLALCALALGSWACADASDPARLDPSQHPARGGGGGGSSSSGLASSSSSGELSASSGSSGHANGDPADPFAADVSYTKDLVMARSATAAHTAGSGPEISANLDCDTCHQNPTGTIPKFALAGLTHRADGSACDACEVLLVDSTGQRMRIVTADDGSFAVKPADFFATVHERTLVGVRKDAAAKPMFTSLDTLNGAVRELQRSSCNNQNCHNSSRYAKPN